MRKSRIVSIWDFALTLRAVPRALFEQAAADIRPAAFVPPSIEDETVFSLLARQRWLLKGRLHLPFLKAVFGKGRRGLAHLMPGSLASFSAAFEPDTPPGMVLRRWTALGYVAPFMEAGDLALAEAGLWSGDPAGLRVVSKYMGRGRAHPTLNWCRGCRDEDVRTKGTPAWRRTHQLPGVFACPRHGTSLLSSAVPALGWPGLVMCPLEGDDPPLALPFSLDKAVRLAQASRWLLFNPQSPQPTWVIQSVFRRLLGEKGLLGANGCGVTGLPEAIAMASGDRHLALGGRGRGSVQRLWGRTARLGVGTAVVLLALDHLGVGVGEFFARCVDLAANPPARESARGAPQVRGSTIARHRRTVAACLDAGRPGRSKLRLAVPTAYCFLLAHDRDWLEAVLPPPRQPRRRVDWRGKDRRLAGEAAAVIAALRARPGRPSRIVYAAIAARMGLRTTLYRRDARLPRTLATMDAAVETLPRLMRRRVEWALGPGRDPSVTTWSAFVRHAGFREHEAGPEVTAWARDVFARSGADQGRVLWHALA